MRIYGEKIDWRKLIGKKVKVEFKKPFYDYSNTYEVADADKNNNLVVLRKDKTHNAGNLILIKVYGMDGKEIMQDVIKKEYRQDAGWLLKYLEVENEDDKN